MQFRYTTALAWFLTTSTPCMTAVLSPARPVTAPSSVASASRAGAGSIPLEAIAKTGRPYDAAWSADGKSLFVSHNQTGRVNLWRYDLGKSEGSQLTRSDNVQQNLTLTPDGKALTFSEDQAGNENRDILSVPVQGGAVTNLTRTTDMSEWGATFAPDGKRMAFLRQAKASPTTEIAIMDLAAGTVTALTEATDRDKEWDLFGWSADGKAVYANLRAVDYSQSGIYRIDVASRRIEAMLPLKPGAQAVGAAVSPNGRFIALSADDGVGAYRAGLLDTETGALHWMRASAWDQHAQAFAPDGLSWLARTQADARTALTLVSVADLSERVLPLPAGVIYSGGTQPFSPDGRMIAFSRSSSAAPPEEWVFDLKTGKSLQVTHIADPRIDAASMPTSDVVTYKSPDGTLISAVLTMPRGLQRNGRNPAVVEVHGGPMDQARDGYDRTAAALASQGFIVIQPNYRGSQGYGRAFQNGDRGDLGGAELQDVLIAKDFLVATGFVDSRRVGIVGGSYGGYLTLMALGKSPGTFATGVQYFGIVDWPLYMESADARLRGIYQQLLGDDRRAWTTASPSQYLDRVRAPLLSLQGDNDIRVPRSQAEMVQQRLQASGVTAETIFYAGEGHGFVREPTRLDALKRTVDWFRRYLNLNDAQ